MASKSFKFWTRDDVQKTFNLNRIYEGFEALTTWLKADFLLSESNETLLKELSKELFLSIEEWNEEELKVWFIGPLLRLVNFKVNNFKAFLDRSLFIIINNEKLQGNVDLCVARGNQNPEQPYFFLHEYKPEKKRDNDPLGQLLIAMVAAQHANNKDQKVYGCYVTGRYWFFVILDDKNYTVSNSYDATDFEDLKIILNALFYVKEQLKKIP